MVDNIVPNTNENNNNENCQNKLVGHFQRAETTITTHTQTLKAYVNKKNS